MGTRQHTYATIRAALELIADRRLATARGVTKPEQYRARILDELRASHHHQALTILEDHPGTDAEILARLLDPPAPSAAAEATSNSIRRAQDQLMAENARLHEEALATPSDPELARQRLGAIRCELGAVHFRTPDEIPATSHWRRFEDLIRARSDCDIDQALDQLQQILSGQTS